MKKPLTILLVLLVCAASAFSVEPPEDGAASRRDVVVYGATPGGIAAAIAASGEGGNVALVEPTRHVGGLTTSGLSHTDFRTYEGLTGLFLDFTRRVEAYYRDKYGPESKQVQACRRGTHAEPHVNEQVFEQMLAERPGITVFKEFALAQVQTAPGENGQRTITRVVFHDAEKKEHALSARVFIDATYEGDLMAMAGVAYRVGREGRQEYGESLAPEQPDGQLQGYNFRLIMTQDPKLRVAVSRPEGYRREDFLGVLPLLADGRIRRVFDYPARCVFKAQIPPLPNGKYDINDVSRGAVRLSLPGENREWPEGDAAVRRRIADAHLRYQVGLLWFLQHDEAVPARFRSEAQTWGWCKDEFTDNGHLPWLLYVREARRMVGQYVFTERDMDPAPGDARSVFHADSIAMGDYGPNCHGTDHEGPRFGGRHTGEFYKRVAPYQIPYGVLAPREVDNLLSPVACSASHVGFCALRLEPIWTSLGQAAGVAARLAAQEGISVQTVPVPHVRRLLHEQGAATIYVSDAPSDSPLFRAVQWLGARGGLHGLAPAGKEPGERGANIEGQYYEAFPGHAFEPEKLLDPALRDRWIALLPESARAAAAQELASDRLTRGEAAARLFQLANE